MSGSGRSDDGLALVFDTPASVTAWRAIDDRVMGGVSRSRMRHDPAGHACFEGTVSLDRGGGFASVRAPVSAVGDAATRGWRLEALGDGRRYRLALVTADVVDGVVYQADFAPAAMAWSMVELPLSAFVARFRGRGVPDAPPLRAAHVRQVGLLIGDRQAGPFVLALRRIEPIRGDG
ncbi:MAG: CIA30 family protein [Burkholderiales bacterium]|nr:MAG: CIA30 family protein [Burkholderiales bacterium]